MTPLADRANVMDLDHATILQSPDHKWLQPTGAQATNNGYRW